MVKMRIQVFLLYGILSLLNHLVTGKHNEIDIKCEDVAHSTFFGKVTSFFGSSSDLEIKVDFYLSTNHNYFPMRVNFDDVKSLHYYGFDRSAKTIILIHGYRSGGLKRWVIQLKDKLLNMVS